MSSLQHSTALSPFLHHLPLRTRSVSMSRAVRLTGLSLSTSFFPFSEVQAVRLLLSCCSFCSQALLQPCLLLWMGSPPQHPNHPAVSSSQGQCPLGPGLVPLCMCLCHPGCAAPGTDAQQNSTARVKGSGGRAGWSKSWAWEPGSSPGSCHCLGNLRNVPAGCARGLSHILACGAAGTGGGVSESTAESKSWGSLQSSASALCC